MPRAVSVIGAGAWGTALACALARNIAALRLCARRPAQAAEMAHARCNAKYLPGVEFPPNLTVTADFDALPEAGLRFVIALPSRAFRDGVLRLRHAITAAGFAPGDATLIWGTKGFEPSSGRLLSEVVAEVFGDGTGTHAVISGPSFAAETARGLPTALTLAATDAAAAQALAAWFRAPATRVYFSDDLIGVQLGGAIKNVLAIAAGISDGLNYGANARAALITRGLAELTRLGVALGGRADTFAGLTGLGDLVLTCTDDQSRNRRFGLGLGRGRPADEVRRDIGQEIEGINTARALQKLSRARNIDMPITTQICRILFESTNPATAVSDLLQRDTKAESERA